jgi:hypothetical protein
MLSRSRTIFKDVVKKISDNKIKVWKTIMAFSIFLFLIVLLVFFLSIFNKKKDAVSSEIKNVAPEVVVDEKQSCSGCHRRVLDGVWDDDEAANKPLVAVMIDNHPSARPQFGLEQASIVYEAEVEGNYTRFMAVYDLNYAKGIEKIGPVRSARSYFLDWAMELGAIYGHCGGSPEALARISDSDIVDLNEFYNGNSFWRDKSREAPHNVMTSWEKLDRFSIANGVSFSEISSWSFKDDADLPQRGEDNKDVMINYSHPYFDVIWRYKKDENAYIRFFENKPQLTGNGNEIIAKNIVVQIISAEVVDEKLRLDMGTIGSGKAVFCLDGKCEEGEWKKEFLDSRTEFYKKDGSAPSFNAGQTWIEVVRPEVSIIY